MDQPRLTVRGQADIARATPYVEQALEQVLAAKPVSMPVTAPYGCSVKY